MELHSLPRTTSTLFSAGEREKEERRSKRKLKRRRLRGMGIDRAELVFIPVPVIGHLISMLEVAKLMVARDQRLSITVLIMRFPNRSELNTHLDSLSDSLHAVPIRFVTITRDDDDTTSQLMGSRHFFTSFIDHHKPLARDAVASRLARPDSVRLAGFVVDLFCTSMMDVVDEFGIPSYVFFTSSAACLGLMLHVRELNDEQGRDPTEFKDSDTDLVVPSFRDPVPIRVLPSVFSDREGGSEMLLKHARGFRRARGILVNTFEELESHALDSFPEDFPPVYPVGPILNIVGNQSGVQKDQKAAAILTWLDEQPPRSVVFLCFGSMGSFDVPQVHEIARGLELSGHRFLWALRRPPPKDTFGLPSEYEDVNEVLPEGFSDRTAGVGKVIGWAPQVAVLSHPAIGGFVSHCGWNSTLEGLWFGVPIATWPLYAEQQINAFQMVRGLGLAAELTLDYKKEGRGDTSVVVGAEEIERGIRRAMEQHSEVRKKVELMSEASRKAVLEGGSSHASLGRFLRNAIGDTSH